MKPKKKLGQNFLRDKNILKFISSRLSNCYTILEIGSGDGRLTRFLLELDAKVFAVELDKDLCDKLIELKKEKSLMLICEDFLKLKPFQIDCIVGNIPYYITSKILFKLLEWNFKEAVLMLQKEFVDKMIAKGGDPNYGRLSVTSQYYFELKPLKFVSKKLFFPVPKVDSTIISLRKKRKKNDEFDDFVRKLFSLKNKKIKNVIGPGFGEFDDMRARHLNLNQVIELFELFKSRIRDR